MPKALFYRRLLSRFLPKERPAVIVLNWELRRSETTTADLLNDLGNSWTVRPINGGYLFERRAAA